MGESRETNNYNSVQQIFKSQKRRAYSDKLYWSPQMADSQIS